MTKSHPRSLGEDSSIRLEQFAYHKKIRPSMNSLHARPILFLEVKLHASVQDACLANGTLGFEQFHQAIHTFLDL